MKKISKNIFLGIIVLCLIIGLAGCGNEEDEMLKNKIAEEINYMESITLAMLNGLNNLSFEDYKIITEKIEGETSSAGSGSSSEGSSQGQSSSKSSSGGQSGENNNASKDTGNMAKLKPDSVMLEEKEADWEKLKLNIEKLNEIWGSTISDLYQVGTNSQDILGFSKDLNIAITSVSAENKQDALKNIAKLHEYYPKYIEASQGEESKYLFESKSNIMKAYSKIEQEDWEGIEGDLKTAEGAYVKVMNNVKDTRQYNVNKVYILLKEFQNALDLKNKEIAYIKYKNLMQEMVIL